MAQPDGSGDLDEEPGVKAPCIRHSGGKLPKTVILLLSHVIDSEIYRHYDRLDSQKIPTHDLFFLCDNSNNSFDHRRNGPNYVLFTSENLQELGYPKKSGARYTEEKRCDNPHHKNFNMPPGNGDLPILHFYRLHPDYDYYWVVEYDVRFSGRWSDFFAAFESNTADLLATTLCRFSEIPTWYHWDSLELLDSPASRDDCVRGFFPVLRLSNRALGKLDSEYSAGAGGHQECLMPTVLYRAGMRIEDIGGRGEFVEAGNENRFYSNSRDADDLSPGSFVFRPVMHRPGAEPNKLWHPVKSRRLFERTMRRLTRAFR